MPNEHPILFSTEMVKAILASRKTQTRRVVKPQPDRVWYSETEPDVQRMKWKGCGYRPSSIVCPYGKPGDTLWVRETFAYINDTIHPDWTFYRANDHDLRIVEEWKRNPNDPQIRWKPSIFMPRAASRINLLIKNIRVERLQEISADDAEAEGVPYVLDIMSEEEQIQMFRDLWDKINGKKYPWDSNPWLWVIEFERILSDAEVADFLNTNDSRPPRF